MVKKSDFKKIGPYLWEIPKTFRKDMRVPARVYASEKIWQDIEPEALNQLVNTTTLPGIVKYALAMPDIHSGYGPPIGGVGAIDPSEGVISPGFVGYDENCLSPDSEVLVENGVRIPIKNLSKYLFCVKTSDLKEGKIKEAPFFNFFKKYTNPSLFVIKTSSGQIIKATGDHPFQTKEGMKQARYLKKGQELLVYPFKGVKYSSPAKKTILSFEDFKKIVSGFKKEKSFFEEVFDILKKENFLPLRYDSPQLPLVLKLMGYILAGGGELRFGESPQVCFGGSKKDLRKIREDVLKLNFPDCKIFIKKNESLKNESQLVVYSKTFYALLKVLSVFDPKRQRVFSRIPQWIFTAPLWQKRLFLASFFGVKLSEVQFQSGVGFLPLKLEVWSQEKKRGFSCSFLKDIKKLLEEFNIQTSKIQSIHQKKSKKKILGWKMEIVKEPVNLVNFFEFVNYEYNSRKHHKACLAALYLKRKLNPTLFSFKEFIAKKSFGREGLCWDRIEEIKKIPYKNFVYDFTVNDPSHNFIANGFVVSNCGVRLLKSNITQKEILPYLEKLATEIQRAVPSGLGRGRAIKLSVGQINKILEGGVPFLVEQGYGEREDVENCEEGGRMEAASADAVSDRAKQRGRDQLGTLGSGNHFLEIQKVAKVFEKDVAEKFGLFEGQVVVMIHTGSRGLGHQNCTDYLKITMDAFKKYNIYLPDRELACVPFNSPQGQRFFPAMSGACNFAFSNRHMISYFVKRVWEKIIGKNYPLSLLYDVAHNIAKLETHEVDGIKMKLLVHRKGATRAFPPGREELPPHYRETGQPVIIPGSMGTPSYVLVGRVESQQAWHTVCHGAGRIMSRHKAVRTLRGQEIVENLKKKGVVVKCWSWRGIAEEAPQAYKDINEVVEVVEKASLAKKVAKLVPLAVIKGE